MRIFFRLLSYSARHKARLCLGLLLGLLGVLIELARPWPVKIVVDHVVTGRPLPAAFAAAVKYLPGASEPQGVLVWCVAIAVVIVVAGGVLSLAVLSVTISIGQRLVFDLSRDLFEKLQRLSLSFYNGRQVGDLLQRINGDVFAVYMAVAQVALPGLVSLVCLLGMFAVMARLDFTLALIALAVVPLLAASLALFTRPMNDTTARQYQKQGALTAFAQQSLTAIPVIQGFVRERYVQEKLEARARDFGRAFETATRVAASYNQVTALVTGTAAALMLGLGAGRVLAGRLSIGDLFVFLGYLAALYGPVNSLSTAVGASVVTVARGRRVFEILDSQEFVREAPTPVRLQRARGEIVFENVTFGYVSDRPARSTGHSRAVLHDISFRASPGQITAIVGATGAGKTSLVSLLSRFYDVWQGRILLDGVDIRELCLADLRANVSLVLQEPFLFPMSISDNIAFGRPGATRDEIVGAARAAHAHDFIERLSNGYDTVIGEKGVTLSGGERQRLAIARAVLKDAPILILDEPTSALDAHTEGLIFEALTQLMKNRTTFIISHRLSTIRRADQILAIEHGHIVERGTHEALVTADNVYAQLYRHQHIAAL